IALAFPLDRDPRPAEDVEDLLLRALEMERSRPLPRVDLDALEADPPRVSSCQTRPRSRDVTALAAPRAHLVPLGDHRSIMSRANADRRPSTARFASSPPSSRDHASASPSSA